MEVVGLGLADLDRVGPLWTALAEHHHEVTGHRWPPRDLADSWARRRAQYEGWLGGTSDATGAWLLGAAAPGDPALLGYAVVLVRPGGGPSWDLGAEVGDLETLSVAPQARGAGVGTALLEAARARLRERGVARWTVSVVAANRRAAALYGRAGFEPFFATMLGEV